jgi:hypothetical protein
MHPVPGTPSLFVTPPPPPSSPPLPSTICSTQARRSLAVALQPSLLCFLYLYRAPSQVSVEITSPSWSPRIAQVRITSPRCILHRPVAYCIAQLCIPPPCPALLYLALTPHAKRKKKEKPPLHAKNAPFARPLRISLTGRRRPCAASRTGDGPCCSSRPRCGARPES